MMSVSSAAPGVLQSGNVAPLNGPTSLVGPQSAGDEPDSTTSDQLGDLPLGGLPLIGGLAGGGDTTSSTATETNPEEDGHTGGGQAGHSTGADACEFFLEHMWKNEDGIPLLGSMSHFTTFHTDPDYKNLILSLASGAIGESQMPIIDIYGGPLGWIPVFNPEHVKGHGTDYVTLLTGCGGIGIPLNTKDLTSLDKMPTPDKLLNLSNMIMPSIPSLPKLMDPNYLYKTLDIAEITDRLSPETLLALDEYLGYAGDNFDAWRLLWETAVSQVASGDPTAILEVLSVLENVNTLESLDDSGLPLFGGGSSPLDSITDLLDGISSLEPGDEPGDQPGDEPGDQPGDEPGDQPGDEPRDEPGDQPGDEPRDEPCGPGTLPSGDLLGGLSLGDRLAPITGLLGGLGGTDGCEPGDEPGDRRGGTPGGDGAVDATGNAKVNGQSVTQGTSFRFTSTDRATLSVEVTNKGNAPITNLSASSQSGSVTCAKSTLAPGEKVTCTVGFSPKSGSQRVKVTVTGADASGATTTDAYTLAYNLCTCGAPAAGEAEYSAELV